MEEFGAVVFKPWHDGKLALLNEQQAIFLLGKMRKTYFRKHLIKAFGDFKWQNRQTLAATQLAAEKADAASSVLAEAAVVINAAFPPKPKKAKLKQAESASLNVSSVESVDGKPSVGSNPLPHVGAISLVGTGGNAPTMSSMEIAKLTGKEHAHVLRDIRNILNEVGIDETKFGAIYLDDMNREQPCFNLPRRECDLVIAGYSAKYRLAIIDRWQELEQKIAQPQFAIPQTYHEALRLSADLAEKNAVITGQLAIASEQLSITSEQLSITAPKAKVLDQIATADGSICISNAAKLVGLSRDDAFSWLYNHGWIFRRGGVGSWVAKDDKRVQGLLEMKVSTIEIKNGREIIKEGVRMTAKGLIKFATALGVELPPGVVAVCFFVTRKFSNVSNVNCYDGF